MREGIQGNEEEAYLSSYSDSLGEEVEVHNVL